jgi:hypothetical protein
MGRNDCIINVYIDAITNCDRMNIENLQIQIKDLESKYDSKFEDIFEAIQFLMTENKEIATQSERTKIGYKK